MIRLCVTIAAIAAAAPAWADLPVAITYMRLEVDRPPVLSNLDPVPEDLGLAGAEIAVKDTQTTGSFLGHSYSLTLASVPPGGDLVAAAREALASSHLILIEADPAAILAVADLPEAQEALLFNVATGAENLRSQDCRANLLHTIPEDAARTDALMQVLQRKQWRTAVMVTGPHPADLALAEAFRRSARKFAVSIAAEKDWTFDTDLRESTMDEVPRFMQDFPDHDVVLIADATDDFGRYIEHNTWIPRPVAGADGLIPTAWSHVIEAWGAVQLQNRFEDHAGRDMRGQDYAAWAAIRAIGEAVTRTNSNDPATIRAFLLDPGFQMDGFKGRGLSFRAWNGQLRQPIAVVNARALVTLAPVEGFLHQRNEMDTLGLDAPESACTAFTEVR
ncbi:ABC transporter substrate-binding protein [Rhodobacter calidifons]|uniref:ABC transporter substrate-binding protein n=1 Tax=Rhodobacter calidifons TaxID=2715277 RepID=A0ABX0GC51_9RHOB|nr:ABC transporter substrate-binding protein [Rhodobacter calidifons]NHB78529.1 ABC transporter substrate-binding protein [Rhodobacter calidifons]